MRNVTCVCLLICMPHILYTVKIILFLAQNATTNQGYLHFTDVKVDSVAISQCLALLSAHAVMAVVNLTVIGFPGITKCCKP